MFLEKEDKSKYVILQATVEGMAHKRRVRVKGERADCSTYRSDWCRFLRKFWSDPKVMRMLNPEDSCVISIEGLPYENGLQWILRELSIMISDKLFHNQEELSIILVKTANTTVNASNISKLFLPTSEGESIIIYK